MAPNVYSACIKAISICVFLFCHGVKACPEDLKGIYVTTFTPMDDKGNLNLTAIPSYADYLKGKGINGVIVTGVAGEGPYLSLKEKKQVLDAWIKERDRCQLHIIVAVQDYVDALEMARYADKMNVSGLAAMSDPYYPPESMQELVYSMRLIAARATNTPFIYFDRPYNNVNLNMVDFFKQATEKIPTFTAYNGQVNTCLRIMAEGLLKENQTLLADSDWDIASTFALRINGTLSIIPNLFPGLSSAIMTAAQSGDMQLARRKQYQLNKKLAGCIFDNSINLYTTTNLASLKAGMTIKSGIDVGPMRPPLPRVSDSRKQQIAKNLS